MTSEPERVAFPDVDMQEILVPWRECLGVPLGPVSPALLDQMRVCDFDYASVFSSTEPNEGVLGLVSRERLEELVQVGQELTKDDEGILFAGYGEIWVRTSLDTLLRKMAERSAWMVVYEGDAEEYGPLFVSYGLVTRSDLNKLSVRVIVYQLLAKLEMALASLVSKSVSDHLSWIRRLSDESQARILGYWELSKLRGVDIGPVASATLAELLKVIGKDEDLRSRIGYNSHNAFKRDVGAIPDIRNQTMHPVRPLITHTESCLRLEAVLRTAIKLTEGVQEALLPGKLR